MHYITHPQQQSLLLEIFNNDRVGVVHEKSLELGCIGGESAPVIHGHRHRQVVFQSHLVVLLAVSGCYVNGSRPLLHGHIIRGYQQRRPFPPGMSCFESGQLCSLEHALDLVVLDFHPLESSLEQGLSHDQILACRFKKDVIHLGM